MKIDYENTELISWVKERYEKKYVLFDRFYEEFARLQAFKISENVEVVGGISPEAHYIMRLVSQYYMECVFEAMKIDMNDPNVAGDTGTPYRIVKMWTGANLDDDTELMSGRWAHKPRIASFPNEMNQKFPITKRVDVVSVCSHHTVPFSTMFREDSYAIVSYIPEDKILGISKLQRIVDHVARRGHLQEGLTQMLYEEVSKAAESESVYIKLFNLQHGCEALRGSQAKDGAFTSEYYGGMFSDPELRKQVKQG